jgi:signal transduction histidine kinase
MAASPQIQRTSTDTALPRATAGGRPADPAVTGDGFLRDLVIGMRCGVLAIDRSERLILINDPALHILELDEAPAAGSPIDRALGAHPQLARILREAFTMSSLPNRAEIDLQCPTEKGKTIGFTLSLVSDDDGKPYGAAVFFKDLTQVEHKEEQERLRDRLAALGQMAASMAHEIRNPLASIEITCGLLRRKLEGQEASGELLDKIISEVRRLNGTIRESLEFVRPPALTLMPAELNPLIEEAIAVATKRSGGPDTRVIQNLEPTIPEFLMDRDQLRQVFENLCVNALEAMDGKGTLTVESSMVSAPAAASIPYRPETSAGPDGEGFDYYVQVRVADTGPGIREEHQDKLFHPFFTTKEDGSGVGLPTASKIVNGHRGLLDVESRPGQGAVFTVRLPLIQAIREG